MLGAHTLVLETSTPHASIALVEPDGVLDQRGFCSDRNHNAMLFEPLQDLLKGAGDPSIGLVLVGSGPGSYSGTRVGIAAAQGVAIALSCPAVALPSILAVPPADGGAPCLAIGDARRRSFWSARMADSRLLGEPELCDAVELEARVAKAARAGFAVFSFEDPGRFPLSGALAGVVKHEHPDAARLWRVWSGTDDETRRHWASLPPQPLYLKPPHITPGKRSSLMRS
jgi:tRNA threonylcarbamoyl adenosine modification protein YeaZ